MNIFNERGCWGGGGSSPDPTPAPAPAPAPSIIEPTEVAAQSQEDRRQKLAKMRRGLASTIKTGAKGLPGAGSDLMSQTLTGKDRLGA